MPTNLPPDYFNADKRYREAENLGDKIACLEEMISLVPKHKGTDKLRADLRRQLSKLKNEADSHKKHGAHPSAYHIEKEGAGQVAVIGPANVGKSALVAALTNAEPEISPAPHTTWKPLPGMMPVYNIQIQLLDTPPLDPVFTEPGLFDLVRKADLVVMVIDLEADPIEQFHASLEMLRSHRILPRDTVTNSPEQERFTIVPIIVVVNKCDDEISDENFSVLCELFEGECPLLPVSAESARYFDQLKIHIYEKLEIIRVYAKPPGEEPDLDTPFVLKKGSTIIDLARKIHRDFYEHLKSARVWGSTAFEGQLVQRDYLLADGDIVELRT